MIRQSFYPKQFPLQIMYIMGVLDPKFDSNLQENLTTSQNSVFWALIYGIWSVKNNFLKIHIFCAFAIMECQRICKNGFSELWTQISQIALLDSKNLFLWIWSSNGWEATHYFWNIMHHEIIGLKLGIKSLAEVVSVNYL